MLGYGSPSRTGFARSTVDFFYLRDAVIDFWVLANIILSWYLWNHAKYVQSSDAEDPNLISAYPQIIRRK